MSFQLLRRLGQKDREFEAYLGYRVSSKPDWETEGDTEKLKSKIRAVGLEKWFSS